MNKKFRQPNPLQVKYGCLHPERMDMEKMLKIQNWIERAIAWRKSKDESMNNPTEKAE